MAWLYVFFDGIIEIFWVLGLKSSHDALTWSGTVILIIFSFYLLMKANETLPAGTVYAVFTGIGTAGIVIVDTVLFGEPMSVQKIIFIACIVTGVMGSKIITSREED